MVCIFKIIKYEHMYLQQKNYILEFFLLNFKIKLKTKDA